MTFLLLSVAIIAVNAQWPKWPSDFSWTMGGGTSKRKNCLHITEAASPKAHTWVDNHFCWKGKSDLGFKWSENGAIAGMKCTNVHEHAAPKYWHNNYLCVPKNSPYNFKWSQSGRISGLSCVQWAENSDPNAWHDNFLCGKPVDPELTRDPIWPVDFRWTMGGGTNEKNSKNCLQIREDKSPVNHAWHDNYFCWKGNPNIGLKWSQMGEISGMKCTNVHEHAAPAYWHNNYLCVPPTSPYNFKWSQSGRISGLDCVQWVENSDPNAWKDNYLCAKRGIGAPTPAPTPAPTEEASYGNIIVWLRQLIAEGKAEIVRIDQKTAALKGKLTAAKKALTEAEKKEGEAEAAADAAATALGKAQGAWKVCLAKFNSEMKRLNEEIAIFTKVKDILSGLINGKQLLEKEKADVKALISEEDQADPVKVRAIIALVQKLIDAAQAEIKRITADKNRCWGVLKKAEEANAAAIGVWKAAQVAVEKAEDNVEAAQGALNAQTQYANKRIAIVNGEIGQFEEIIELLNPLFE